MNQAIFDMYVPLIITTIRYQHSLILHTYHLKTYTYMTYLNISLKFFLGKMSTFQICVQPLPAAHGGARQQTNSAPPMSLPQCLP